MSKSSEVKTAQAASAGDVEHAPFKLRNYILFGVGLAVIVGGWFLLRAGHITVAPVMLVLGYCAILPLAIILK
jgi:hypothetical protein